MAGLLSTGIEYQQNALKGFIRESALEEKIREANNEIAAQQDNQKAKMGAEGAAVGAIGGYALATSSAVAGTEVGAELGSWAGPVGMVAGAGLGFLFSRLF